MAADTPSDGPGAVRIMEVMESWPVQLRVLDGVKERIVDLDDMALVKRDGIDVGSGALAPGLSVRLQVGGPDPQTVQVVEILGD